MLPFLCASDSPVWSIAKRLEHKITFEIRNLYTIRSALPNSVCKGMQGHAKGLACGAYGRIEHPIIALLRFGCMLTPLKSLAMR